MLTMMLQELKKLLAAHMKVQEAAQRTYEADKAKLLAAAEARSLGNETY
jgi:hypothetical protein